MSFEDSTFRDGDLKTNNLESLYMSHENKLGVKTI